MTNSPETTTDLAARAAALAEKHNALYLDAKAKADEQAVMVNRLAAVEMMLEADLPRTAVVEMTDWADEDNEGWDDGMGSPAFSVDLGEAYDPETEESYGDLGGHGALPAGHYDGNGEPAGTDWDLFATDGEVAPGDMVTLSVAKAYDWLTSLDG